MLLYLDSCTVSWCYQRLCRHSDHLFEPRLRKQASAGAFNDRACVRPADACTERLDLHERRGVKRTVTPQTCLYARGGFRRLSTAESSGALSAGWMAMGDNFSISLIQEPLRSCKTSGVSSSNLTRRCSDCRPISSCELRADPHRCRGCTGDAPPAYPASSGRGTRRDCPAAADGAPCR